MSEFFRFENEKEDIPFYNGIPELNLTDWIVLLAGLLLFVGLIILPINIDGHVLSILLCLVMIIPVIWVTRGNLRLFFKKPKRSDAKLIILCLIGYYLYTMIIAGILIILNLPTNANAILSSNIDLFLWISVFIQLIGEEFFKIITFILVMALVYYLTKNRKLCIYCGLIVTFISFGLIHYGAYGSIFQIILIQGFGSIFEMYAYLKTKNVVVTYILHVLIDAFPFIIAMIYKMYDIPLTT